MKAKLPYEGSCLSPEQSRMQIEKLLKEAGCKDYQWTVIASEYVLKFALPVTVKGVEKVIGFRFIPPQIPKTVRQYDTKQYRYVKVSVNDDVTAFRVLFWYLKNKIAAIRTGLVSAEQELMANILFSLPDGSEKTLGEKLQEELPRLSGMNNFAVLPALEEKTNEKKPIVIDMPKGEAEP